MRKTFKTSIRIAGAPDIMTFDLQFDQQFLTQEMFHQSNVLSADLICRFAVSQIFNFYKRRINYSFKYVFVAAADVIFIYFISLLSCVLYLTNLYVPYFIIWLCFLY
jgi:hypothetical protein